MKRKSPNMEQQFFAIEFFKEGNGFHVFVRKNNITIEECMDALFTFICDGIDEHDVKILEVLSILMTVSENIKVKYPPIAAGIRKIHIEHARGNSTENNQPY